MKRAFTLVEILIVVAILGILAAVVVPTLKNYSTQAKESAAKDDLRILRTAIERYIPHHNGFAPGYVNGVLNLSTAVVMKQFYQASNSSGETVDEPTEGYNLGPYMSAVPTNPFNNKNTIRVLSSAAPFPDPPTNTEVFGWIYKPSAKAIKLNYPGADSKGVKYYDY